MTVEEITARVEAIRAQAGDDEVAHGNEDELHLDVLKAIAAGYQNPVALAKAALATESIDFERWYA